LALGMVEIGLSELASWYAAQSDLNLLRSPLPTSAHFHAE
jgi:hypothetical protein